MFITHGSNISRADRNSQTLPILGISISSEEPTQKCETVSVKHNNSLNKSVIFTNEYSFPGTTTILSECSQTSGGKSLSKYSKTTVPTSKIYFYDYFFVHK